MSENTFRHIYLQKLSPKHYFSDIAYVKVDIIAIYKIFHVGYELKER